MEREGRGDGERSVRSRLRVAEYPHSGNWSLKCEETREKRLASGLQQRRPNNSLHRRKGKTMGAVARASWGVCHPWCMIMSGTSVHYSTKEKEEGGEKRIAIVETHLNATFPCWGVHGSAVMAAPGDEEKDPEESQRRFSTTTRIKDNPIRLELILWELHFSSTKY